MKVSISILTILSTFMVSSAFGSPAYAVPTDYGSFYKIAKRLNHVNEMRKAVKQATKAMHQYNLCIDAYEPDTAKRPEGPGQRPYDSPRTHNCWGAYAAAWGAYLNVMKAALLGR